LKLSLRSLNGVEILTGSEEISSRVIQVLRAGITRLMKSGKNRIVFEVPSAEKLPPDVLREISQLDLLARELSGRVILAGNSPVLRQQIVRFAQPPIIECFDSVTAAIQYFAPPKPADSENLAKAPPAAGPATVTKPVAATAAASPAAAAAPEQTAARSIIRQKELTELTEFRKRISQLENENQLLKDRVLAALVQRRVPATPAAAQKKIEALEQKIEELLTEVGQPAKK
jgi:hypothetical protein